MARFGIAVGVEHPDPLERAGHGLIATEAVARADLLPAQLARRCLAVWLADDQLVASLLSVAAVRDPARAAALLARMRLVPARRAQLRQLMPSQPARQLPLL